MPMIKKKYATEVRFKLTVVNGMGSLIRYLGLNHFIFYIDLNVNMSKRYVWYEDN